MPNDPIQPIIQNAQLVDAALDPFIRTLNPAIGEGISLALRLLAIAEPAAYSAIVAVIQGTPLTVEQVAEKDAAIARLQNPGQYFE